MINGTIRKQSNLHTIQTVKPLYDITIAAEFACVDRAQILLNARAVCLDYFLRILRCRGRVQYVYEIINILR